MKYYYFGAFVLRRPSGNCKYGKRCHPSRGWSFEYFWRVDLIVNIPLIAHLSLYTSLKPTCDKKIGTTVFVYIINQWALDCRARGPGFKFRCHLEVCPTEKSRSCHPFFSVIGRRRRRVNLPVPSSPIFTSVAFRNFENYFCKFWEVCKFGKSGKFGEICRAYLRDIFHKISQNTALSPSHSPPHTHALHLTHTLSLSFIKNLTFF